MSKAWARGSTPAWRRIRAAVLQRDNYRCRIKVPGVCTEKATQVHHTLGRALTGDDGRYLVAACAPCNRKIGDPLRRDPPGKGAGTRW